MTGPVLSLALSSSLLAVLLPGGSARVWSRSSLSPELEVMGAREDRVSLALGEGEVFLGTKEELAGSKAQVEVWSVAQGALAQRLEVQEGSVTVTGLEVVGDRLLASLTSLGPWTSLQVFSRTREGWAPCYSLAQLELGRLGPCQGSVLSGGSLEASWPLSSWSQGGWRRWCMLHHMHHPWPPSLEGTMATVALTPCTPWTGTTCWLWSGWWMVVWC